MSGRPTDRRAQRGRVRFEPERSEPVFERRVEQRLVRIALVEQQQPELAPEARGALGLVGRPEGRQLALGRA